MNDNSDKTQNLIRQGTADYFAGDRDAARHAFGSAHDLDPTNLTVNYFLAAIADDDGEAPRAERHYRSVLAEDPTVRQAYFQLANALFLQGKKWEALSILRSAELRFPEDREIPYYRGQLASRTLPSWHLPMLADQRRNDAFEEAIQATIKPGDIVLDIGTGSGLLAMMAARAGAAHVYACDAEEIMAELARQIVKRNGLEDRITILGKHSSQLRIGEDLPRKADVLISEIFDRGLLGEGVLPTLGHAWQDLLQPDARAIPNGATLHGALIECPRLRRAQRIEAVNGFDLSPMNVLAPPLTYKNALMGIEGSEDHRILTESFRIKDFEFQSAPDIAFRTECPVSIIRDGQADAILMWFDLRLAPGVELSTRDTTSQEHWRQALQALPDRIACRSVQATTLSTHYSTFFDFTVRTDGSSDRQA